ncbi:hypothetical protein HT031_003352 [Scenedesmus sp. PABB004]|nr:hypothetical protein HT031_003352 [Scenedesmus sp. PABB004]
MRSFALSSTPRAPAAGARCRAALAPARLSRRLAAITRAALVEPGDKVLVVGATGGVGQLATAKLLERGYKVRALTRKPDAAKQLFSNHPSLEVVSADLRDASTLPPVVAGVDAVCCCTGTTAFPSDRWKGDNGPRPTDYDGPRNLIAACPKTLKRFVFVTSAGVERRTQMPWAILNTFGVLKFKRESEQLLEASGLPYTILRPSRLTDGPYTSYDLNTLLQATSGSRREVVLAPDDSLLGEASRIAVAEAAVQALQAAATENRAFALESVEGEGPGQDAAKWAALFAGCYGEPARSKQRAGRASMADSDDDAPPPLSSLADQRHAASLAGGLVGTAGLKAAGELRVAATTPGGTPAAQPAAAAKPLRRGFLDAKPARAAQQRRRPPQQQEQAVIEVKPARQRGGPPIPAMFQLEPSEQARRYEAARKQLLQTLAPTPETVAAVGQDPTLAAGFDDPEVMAAVAEVGRDPAAIKKYARNAKAFTGHELAELVGIAPEDGAMKTGFRLQDPEVDDVVRAARDLEAGCVQPDAALSAEENVELLLRATRLLQLGLEVQYAEAEHLLGENNGLRDDLRALEDQNRGLDAELGELRELRDREGTPGDVRELELELKELRHEYEEERKASDRLIEQSDRDKQTIDALEARVARGDELLKLKDGEAQDLREQLGRLRDDFDELRAQYAALTAAGGGKDQQREMGDTIRQQEWKIERLTKDNRALEASNCELRAQLDAIREENLQARRRPAPPRPALRATRRGGVSENILMLDGEARALRLAAAQADDKAEVLAREKGVLAAAADELRADVAAKMALLDEFEDRFNRQFRSWEEERGSLTAQVEALRMEARLAASATSRGGGRHGGGGGADDGGGSEAGDAADGASPEAQLAAVWRALDEAKENEVLLLEAYEQLEADVGAEVDRALARQSEELGRLGRRVAFLEGQLEAERKQTATLGDEAARLEGALGDAAARNAQYESGVYGLPQAAQEIRQLKEAAAGGEARVKELVLQVNHLSAALEDVSDEAVLLRRKAGLPDGARLDTAGVKLAKEVTIAQLRSVNALLERQVSDLEEERRKLRLEVKFRAKYHGRAALEMGLSSEQLLLLEEYVESLKGGRQPEERLVTQLQQRIEFLEVRLAEVMAYSDIPINMRPAITELSAGGGGVVPPPGLAAVAAAGRGQLLGAGGGGPGADGGGGVAGGIMATQVELVRGALLGCLKMLRQMSEALAEHRQVSDAEYSQFTEGVIEKLMDAERVASLILRDLAAAPGGGGGAAAERGEEARRAQRRALLTDDFVADAAAEELRDRLRQLARQVVELQVSLAQKDAQLGQLAGVKAALEARFGLADGEGGPDEAPAAPAPPRRGDYVPREQHEELELELGSVKEQLLESLEELSARERELSEVGAACSRYQSSMAGLAGQVQLLYKEYAASAAAWRLECSSAEKQLDKARAEAADATARLRSLEAALATLEAGDLGAMQRSYVDAVRKAAVVQLKHAKLARQLEASTAAEKAAGERVEELQEELQDCTSTCRSRIRWLEQAAADAARRTQTLYRCLRGAAPIEAYQHLVEKHSQLAREHRALVEQMGDAPCSEQAEELLAARRELAELLPRYDDACNTVAELRETLRQLELPAKLRGRQGSSFMSPAAQPDGGAAGTAGGPAAPAGASSGAAEVALALNQDLVAAAVKLEGLARRLELAEREKERVGASLAEAQAHNAELEQRLAQVSAELSTSRALEGCLQARLAASVPAAQLEDAVARLEAAEAASSQQGGAAAALLARAEDAERRLAELGGRKQRQLADITNLRSAVCELSSGSDAAAALGKLHGELDHARAKESLARSALNRSEAERSELERQARGLRQQVASLGAQLAVAQDHARWAESELLDSLTRLELGLASGVEGWKASRWAAKLETLKARNDGLATGLAAAVRRLAKLEDAAQEGELRAELAEDVQSLLARGASDVQREAAALKQQHVALRLEAGRLGRAELLLRQKVAYLERVNAELCELLERGDAEALAAAGGLQAEKRELLARMRALQEEVVRLQDRSGSLLAELEEAKAARGGRAGASAGAGAPAAGAQGGRDAASLAAVTHAAVADKELLLAQIDSLKEARTEAEHMRQECRDLQAQLERQQAQLEDLQLRSVAEAATRELHAKVADREAQLAALAGRLAEHQAAYLAQHAKDRAEIEALSNKLFDSGAASIAGLKANLSRTTAALAATGNGREQLPYEQLRLLLEERSSEAEVLRSRLEQREASLEVMRKNYEAQAQRQDAEVQRLTAALAAAPREDPNAPSARQALHKLAAEARLKDERLRQLRAAIKALEGKLSQLLKDKTDLVMQASSWVEQEHLDERLAELEAQKAELAAQLAEAQAELAAARAAAAAQDAALRKQREQLLHEREAAARLRAALAKEQGLVSALRAKAAKAAADAPAGSQEALALQVAALQGRVAELELEVQRLTAQLRRQAALAEPSGKAPRGGEGLPAVRIGKARPSLGEGVSSPGTPDMGPPAPGGAARGLPSSDGGGGKPSRLSSATGAAGKAGPAPDASRPGSPGGSAAGAQPSADGGASASAPGGVSYAPQAWEESKQQQARIEALRCARAACCALRGGARALRITAAPRRRASLPAAARRKLAKKSEELDAATKECERRGALVAALTTDKERGAVALAAATAKLRRLSAEAAPASHAAPRADASKLKDYVERVLALEGERDELALQLEALKQRQGQPPQRPAVGQEDDLLELRLQKEQAVAAAARLRRQLSELFDADAGADVGPTSTDGGGGGRAAGRRSGSGAGGGAGKLGAREAELLSTVANLKAALERAMACSTPNSRFMQEVKQRKAAQREAAQLRGELDKLRPQLAAADARVAELLAANAELRVALAELRGAAEEQAGGGAAGWQQGGGGGGGSFAAQLQAALAAKDAEAERLRASLADMAARLDAATAAAGGGGGPGSDADAAGGALAVLRERLAAVEGENAELRREIEALDPAFFDEVEDLKHSHAQLSQTCAAQAALIARLQASGA